MKPARTVLSLLAALALWTAAPAALAEPPTATVESEVLVIHGLAEGSGVDPALKSLAALSEPPFNSFPQKRLLSQSNALLAVDIPSEVDLPNGRKLRLTLLGTGKDGRHRVRVSINRPGKTDYLPVMTVKVSAGDPFFVAGQKFKKGTLIIGVRIGQAPARGKAAAKNQAATRGKAAQ